MYDSVLVAPDNREARDRTDREESTSPCKAGVAQKTDRRAVSTSFGEDAKTRHHQEISGRVRFHAGSDVGSGRVGRRKLHLQLPCLHEKQGADWAEDLGTLALQAHQARDGSAGKRSVIPYR